MLAVIVNKWWQAAGQLSKATKHQRWSSGWCSAIMRYSRCSCFYASAGIQMSHVGHSSITPFPTDVQQVTVNSSDRTVKFLFKQYSTSFEIKNKRSWRWDTRTWHDWDIAFNRSTIAIFGGRNTPPWAAYAPLTWRQNGRFTKETHHRVSIHKISSIPDVRITTHQLLIL